MPLAIGVALAVSLVLGGGDTPAQAAVTSVPKAATPKQFVENYFADIPVMADIASCESHDHQYDDDGSVYRGKINHADVGIMQVNEYYHAATAKKLGLDLYTMQGNVAYARYLYDKEGVQPWVSSRPCWGPKAVADGSLKQSELASAQK